MIRVGRKTTMTVQELIDYLQKKPNNLPVFAAWEGVRAGFRPSNFEVEKVNDVDCLVVDVEDYFA